MFEYINVEKIIMFIVKVCVRFFLSNSIFFWIFVCCCFFDVNYCEDIIEK